ncbi:MULTISPECIES: Asp23/Gls24 family envelope stress response protein [unclassified Brevibacterium]|uniref:Asp23/Gls24 family envelope stress response protein n=1 Tax=unclassified Brevibacterium TaxID=2614124 RepID=UPI001951D4C9|nr:MULTISPECIES: Asp23/Gls24 family envelope stress response protein [unclassified Brevibacterium]MBM6589684.1 Asp23/Gls24 family envelope stress response protein [Brevibacterium sp. RIT 803]MCF2572192.1 Asp23/Gls24 family envelope stress response protein [Brevibacterium sp. UCMA 11754]MCF2586700.1 Asp23/Gls24 family envelope stress response protein [Brevibacterium sp. UCMA 11752]
MPEDKQSTVSQQSRTDDSVRSPLVTDMGNTTIAENVVAKLSGIAAREVPGVFGMGNAARRTFDALAERIPGSQTNVSGGVSVEKGEKQTAIDLTIVVEYGTSIVDVAEAIRRNVIRAVEQGTGLQVVEVNIEVTDVHLPGDDDDQQNTNDTVELN